MLYTGVYIVPQNAGFGLDVERRGGSCVRHRSSAAAAPAAAAEIRCFFGGGCLESQNAWNSRSGHIQPDHHGFVAQPHVPTNILRRLSELFSINTESEAILK